MLNAHPRVNTPLAGPLAAATEPVEAGLRDADEPTYLY